MGALASPRWLSYRFLIYLIGGCPTVVVPRSRDSADICPRPLGPHFKGRNSRRTVSLGPAAAAVGADAPVAARLEVERADAELGCQRPQHFLARIPFAGFDMRDVAVRDTRLG